MSSSPPASSPTVWPPSNPSGTVIPFPLPWGQTGCCPPGGMDALMKCYCDIQQASAFIGQIMLDQINNNPAIIAAIIAGIEASGSSLPLIGVTNGQAAQPGQVGEFVLMQQQTPYPTAAQQITLTMGVLQPGDWDVWGSAVYSSLVAEAGFSLTPLPVGFTNIMEAVVAPSPPNGESVTLWAGPIQALISVPTLVVYDTSTNAFGPGPSAGEAFYNFYARRAR